ncbi:thiamine-binding protein [mine drainage metagenome]|uniref:Thiamine-binding protein n=1 Tax=mine drainage metagenome TaxID=410659 RepID=T1CUH0_9ZZZZ
MTSWNHTLYGWQTIYGIGIVAGTQHLSLDEQFINWFLNGTVQSEIPLNEWEYPANRTVPLPSEYRGLIDPNSIVPLNEYTTPSALAANIVNWQNEWQTLANQYAPP